MPSLLEPIVIDGISFLPLKESIGNLIKTVTTPAIEESTGLMGATATEPFKATTIRGISFGTNTGRVKDIKAVDIVFSAIADRLKGTNPELSKLYLDNLKTIRETPTGKPITPSTGNIIKSENPIVWQGIKIGDYPLVGLSRGNIVVGNRGITLPPLEKWDLVGAEGKTNWTIQTGLESKILVNKDALM
jgi:hypothetical protein